MSSIFKTSNISRRSNAKWFLILALVLNSIHELCSAQTTSIKELEQNVVDIYSNLIDNKVYRDKDSLIRELNSQLPILITHKESCNFRFDSLGKYIYITSSKDKRIRIFSWDEFSGGTYHFFTNYLQLKTRDNSCKIIPFDQSEESPEVSYTSIKTLIQNNKPYYFFFGSGTYGGGEKHEVLRIFEIKNDTITECTQCYPSNKFILVRSNRGQRIEINLDIERAELSYNQFEINPEYGVYSNKFNKITFKFINGKLIRNN